MFFHPDTTATGGNARTARVAAMGKPHNVICAWCGDTFVAVNAYAKYCQRPKRCNDRALDARKDPKRFHNKEHVKPCNNPCPVCLACGIHMGNGHENSMPRRGQLCGGCQPIYRRLLTLLSPREVRFILRYQYRPGRIIKGHQASSLASSLRYKAWRAMNEPLAHGVK